MGIEEDDAHLGGWMSVSLRGAEGRMVGIVSVHAPVQNVGGTESVAGQHRNCFDAQGVANVDDNLCP